MRALRDLETLALHAQDTRVAWSSVIPGVLNILRRAQQPLLQPPAVRALVSISEGSPDALRMLARPSSLSAIVVVLTHPADGEAGEAAVALLAQLAPGFPESILASGAVHAALQYAPRATPVARTSIFRLLATAFEAVRSREAAAAVLDVLALCAAPAQEYWAGREHPSIMPRRPVCLTVDCRTDTEVASTSTAAPTAASAERGGVASGRDEWPVVEYTLRAIARFITATSGLANHVISMADTRRRRRRRLGAALARRMNASRNTRNDDDNNNNDDEIDGGGDSDDDVEDDEGKEGVDDAAHNDDDDDDDDDDDNRDDDDDDGAVDEASCVGGALPDDLDQGLTALTDGERVIEPLAVDPPRPRAAVEQLQPQKLTVESSLPQRLASAPTGNSPAAHWTVQALAHVASSGALQLLIAALWADLDVDSAGARPEEADVRRFSHASRGAIVRSLARYCLIAAVEPALRAALPFSVDGATEDGAPVAAASSVGCGAAGASAAMDGVLFPVAAARTPALPRPSSGSMDGRVTPSRSSGAPSPASVGGTAAPPDLETGAPSVQLPSAATATPPPPLGAALLRIARLAVSEALHDYTAATDVSSWKAERGEGGTEPLVREALVEQCGERLVDAMLLVSGVLALLSPTATTPAV